MREDDEVRDANDQLDDQLEEDDAGAGGEDEDEMEHEDAGRSRAAGFAVGIAIGALVGAAAALLLAPTSGRTVRRRLRAGLEEVKDRAHDEWDQLSRKARRELKRRIDSV